MPQRPKRFFPLFHFFLLSRLDFVQLPWKRSQFGKQVQILAQFLFIYRASYFSNCCQVKTVFNRRQVNMPIPFLGLSHPLSCGRRTMPCWVWPWLPEGWGPTQLRDVTRSDLGPCLLSLRSFGRKARSCEPGVPILVWQLADPMTCKCYLASWSQDLLILFNS